MYSTRQKLAMYFGSERSASAESVADKHQLRILVDTLKNPLKGRFMGGPSAEEAEDILRSKFKYTESQIQRLKAANHENIMGKNAGRSSRYADSRYADSRYADSRYAESRYASDWDELDYDSDLMAAAPEGCGTSGKSRFTKVTNPIDKAFKGVSGKYGPYKKHHEYGETGFGPSDSPSYKKKYNEWYMEDVFDGNC